MQQYRKDLGKVSLTSEGAWEGKKSYKVLSIVYDEHTEHGFISKKDVPVGVDLYNKEYWMPLNVSGYADNNMIILADKVNEHSIKSYTLEEAILSIAQVGRRPGTILGFYNENADRLDIGGRWELWQFNDTNIYNWDNVDSWQNLYYNYNKFMGWFKDENFLNKYAPFPEIGCYAFVGSEFNEATVYRCDNKYVWKNTTQHAWDYVKVVVDGNVTVGENGNWFNDGKDTGIPASVKGENGKTPVFREKDNIIQYSFDNVNWITISDKVAAWFRWNATIGDTQANNVGRIQISRDNVTWTNLSGDIVNNLHISRYIGADESLPTKDIAEGTIYAKGPYYAEDDTLNDNPIYRLWVYAWKGNTLAWVDNGEFQSIAAGIVQELGNSENTVISQKKTTETFKQLSSDIQKVFKYSPDTKLPVQYILPNGYLSEHNPPYAITLEEGNKSFSVESIKVEKDITYLIYSSYYKLAGDFPAVAFSTEIGEKGKMSKEAIYYANTSPREVEILYTPLENGYLWLAKYNGELDVYIPSKENRIDIAEENIKTINSNVKGIKILTDSEKDLEIGNNFDFILPLTSDALNYRIGTVYDGDGYNKRIIFRKADDSSIVVDNTEGTIITNDFIFRYDWNKHTTNINQGSYNTSPISIVENPNSYLYDIINQDIENIKLELSENGVKYVGNSKPSTKERSAISNFKFFYCFGESPTIRINVIYDGDGYNKRIGFVNPDNITTWIDNAEGLISRDNYIFLYDWDNHTGNINYGTNYSDSEIGIEKLNTTYIGDYLIKYISEYILYWDKDFYTYKIIEDDILEYDNIIESAYMTNDKTPYLGSIKGGNANFIVKNIPVKQGTTYNLYSEKFKLGASIVYCAVAFSTRPAAIGVAAQKSLYTADNYTRKVDFLFTPEQDGYLWIAEVLSMPNYEPILVHNTTKILKADSIYGRYKSDILPINEEIISGYLIGEPPRIGKLEDSYPTFIVRSYKVLENNQYILYSKDFALADSFPAIAFSTTKASAGETALETIYSADTTKREVDIKYTPKQDGYIWIATAGRGDINIYNTQTINRIDKLENNVSNLENDINYLKEYGSEQFSDKTIAILGDSIMMLMRTGFTGNSVTYLGSNGVTYQPSEVKAVEGKIYAIENDSIQCEVINSNQKGLNDQNWEDLQNKLRIKNLINLGLGGAMNIERSAITAYPYPDNNANNGIITTSIPNQVRWLKRLVDSGEKQKPNIIVIWAGTNDSGQTKLDNYDEVMNADWSVLSNDEQGLSLRKTEFGGMRYYLEFLSREYPEATIFVVSPTQSRYSSNKDYDTGNLQNIVESMRKMSNRYACIFLDAFNDIGICDLFELRHGDDNTSATWLYDGLHPNAKGKILYANYLVSKLRSLYFSKV